MTSRDFPEARGDTKRRVTSRRDTKPRVAESRHPKTSRPQGESKYRPSGLSPEQLRALPAAVPFDPVVPAAFGISRSAAYRALAAGQLPIKPLRLGRRLIVRRADLLMALGLLDEPTATRPDPPSGGPTYRKDI